MLFGFLAAAPWGTAGIRALSRVWIYVLAAYVAIAWIYGGIDAWDRWPAPDIVMDAALEGLLWPYRLWLLIFLGAPPK